MASVLVLYRVVRRLSGALAGIVAAAVLVVSPATVLLNRGNIPDTLMILLLLLAADATVSAILSGRLRSLVVAGILVGLAFQAKMIEAWLVLPALALAYLVGARDPWVAGWRVSARRGWWSRPCRSPGWCSCRCGRRVTARTSTAAATTRSSTRCSSTTASAVSTRRRPTSY